MGLSTDLYTSLAYLYGTSRIWRCLSACLAAKWPVNVMIASGLVALRALVVSVQLCHGFLLTACFCPVSFSCEQFDGFRQFQNILY